MPRYRLSAPALQDLVEILAYTDERFGEAARERYEELVLQALMDLAPDPERLGSWAKQKLGEGVRIYHLRHSRARTRSGTVRTPRHLIVFKLAVPDVIGVGRILHDAMDLTRRHFEEFGDETEEPGEGGL